MLSVENLCFLTQDSSQCYYLAPDLYQSITDIVQVMNTLIQGRHNHTVTSNAVKKSRRTQKVEIHLAKNEGSGLAFFSTDLGHIFGSNVDNDFGVLLRRKGPHKPVFAYDNVRIHSLMIYTDLIEYIFVGDTKAPCLRCFSFISKLKAGDIITTGQYVKYQTFTNLHFRPLLKLQRVQVVEKLSKARQSVWKANIEKTVGWW